MIRVRGQGVGSVTVAVTVTVTVTMKVKVKVKVTVEESLLRVRVRIMVNSRQGCGQGCLGHPGVKVIGLPKSTMPSQLLYSDVPGKLLRTQSSLRSCLAVPTRWGEG